MNSCWKLQYFQQFKKICEILFFTFGWVAQCKMKVNSVNLKEANNLLQDWKITIIFPQNIKLWNFVQWHIQICNPRIYIIAGNNKFNFGRRIYFSWFKSFFKSFVFFCLFFVESRWYFIQSVFLWWMFSIHYFDIYN